MHRLKEVVEQARLRVVLCYHVAGGIIFGE